MSELDQMTMSDIMQRAKELGFKPKKKRTGIRHWSQSQELRAFEFLKMHNDEDGTFSNDAA